MENAVGSLLLHYPFAVQSNVNWFRYFHTVIFYSRLLLLTFFFEYQNHYGLKDESSVQLIKTLYKELGIPQLYADHEESSYKELTKLVKNIENDLPSVVFQGFMDKIYKRKL